MSKILIIEDEYAVRENLQEILEMEDFEVFTAENGKVGVQMALEHQPDLIICDVMMPELDGYGVISALRTNPSTFATTFLFLSANSTPEDKQKGLKLGATDYLTKPFTPREIRSAIATQLPD
jgi:DNA-binding response OmpR family regulator